MNLKRFASIALAAAMTASIAVSASAESSYPGTPGDDEATFYITMEPTGLSTMESTYGEEFKILNNLYVGLTDKGENDEAIPGIAESWDISDDGLVYQANRKTADYTPRDLASLATYLTT